MHSNNIKETILNEMGFISNGEKDEFELKSSYSNKSFKRWTSWRTRSRGWFSRQMDLVGHERGSRSTQAHDY